MGLGQSSSGTPWIAHSLFLFLLMRSIALSNQLLLKWVLVIGLQSGLMSTIPRKRLRRRGIQESTFLPEDYPYLNRPYEASLVLVSDQFKHDAYYIEMLRNLKLIRYYVILVTPTEDINKPESPEWPGSLIDIGGWCPFNDETSEPCSKKYKGG
ncbi:hypothetical protein F2Q70_00014043 [Brassica cretica]|uniref:Uncharacterized protein n=1 Tax=Brassica cretica TaxID=69181 RepID=A0A8S9HWE8_BRACR|nr:hypothetical protein F2Q70_00014043 [Brassica cretica]